MPHTSRDRVPIDDVHVVSAAPIPEDKHPFGMFVMLGATFLVIIGLLVQFWPETEGSGGGRATHATEVKARQQEPPPVRTSDRRPGTWRVLVGEEWSSEPFCAASGTYTSLSRSDDSVGIWITRQVRANRPWQKEVYRGPSANPDDGHLDFGAFKCLRFKAGRSVEIVATISRNPPHTR